MHRNHAQLIKFSSDTDADLKTVISILGAFRNQLEQAYRQQHPISASPITRRPLPPPPAIQPAPSRPTSVGSIGAELIPPVPTEATPDLPQPVDADVIRDYSLLVDVLGFRDATEMGTGAAQEVQDLLESLQPTISTFLKEGIQTLLTGTTSSNTHDTSGDTVDQDAQPPSTPFRLWWIHVPANNTEWVHVCS
jgi:hypothetical protein